MVASPSTRGFLEYQVPLATTSAPAAFATTATTTGTATHRDCEVEVARVLKRALVLLRKLVAVELADYFERHLISIDGAVRNIHRATAGTLERAGQIIPGRTQYQSLYSSSVSSLNLGGPFAIDIRRQRRAGHPQNHYNWQDQIFRHEMIYLSVKKDVIPRRQVTWGRICCRRNRRVGPVSSSQRVPSTMVRLPLYDEMFANYFLFIPRLLPAWMLLLAFVAPANSAEATSPAASPRVIVIGFVGGFVRRNDTVHQEVQLAAHLRAQYPTRMQVKMFENRQGRQARREVLEMLDADRDGGLSDREKRTARIVIYGHSWGASEGVTLARTLGQEGIPVLLTIQVDSVEKRGEDDRWIPANVGQAVNFYQANGLLRGRSEIQAADSSRTEILGNYRVDYKIRHVNCDGFPWYAQMFMSSHIKIECDPSVWSQVESLIRSKLPVD